MIFDMRTDMNIFTHDTDSAMISTMEDKRRLLQEVMDINPHLHYSWETAEDYLNMFKETAPDSSARMEAHMIDLLELRNASWTFSNAEYYNPYWKMSKKEFEGYSNEMNKIFFKQ